MHAQFNLYITFLCIVIHNITLLFRGFQLRRNHARVSSSRFSLPLPHAPHSEPILLQVSWEKKHVVSHSTLNANTKVTLKFKMHHNHSFTGAGSDVLAEWTTLSLAPIYSILLYVHIQARRVRALFSTHFFRYFAPTTRMYANIRGSSRMHQERKWRPVSVLSWISKLVCRTVTRGANCNITPWKFTVTYEEFNIKNILFNAIDK